MEKQLFNTLLLPEASRPIRLPGFPVIEKTSVNSFSVPATRSTCVTKSTVTPEYTKFILTRNPLQPLWWSFTTDGAAVNQGAWTLTYDVFGSAIEYQETLPELCEWSWGPYSGTGVLPRNTTATFTDALTTDQAIVAQDAKWTYVWAPFVGSLVATVTLGSAAASASTAGVATVVDALGTVYRIPLSCAVGDFCMSGKIDYAGVSNWVRIQSVSLPAVASGGAVRTAALSTSNAASSAVAITNGTTSGLISTLLYSGGPVTVLTIPAWTNPEYKTSRAPFLDTRVTAVGLRAENITKLANVDGNFLMVRCDPSVDPNKLTYDDMLRYPQHLRCFGRLAGGFYAALTPGKDLYDWKNYLVRNTPTVAAFWPPPYYDLTSEVYNIVGVLYDSDSGTQLNLNLNLHIEHRTASQLFPLGTSRLSMESVHRALLHLDQVGTLFDTGDLSAIKAMRSGRAPRMSKPVAMQASYQKPPKMFAQKKKQPQKTEKKGKKENKPQPKQESKKKQVRSIGV